MKKNRLSALVFALALCGSFLPSAANALVAVDHEQLVAGTGCPTLGQSAADWDTFAQCPSTSGTWARGPAFLGATSDTCDANHAGMLQFNGGLLYCSGSAWVTLGGGGTEALSSLTASLANNSIDSANFAQTWTWNTLSTGTALTLTSSTDTSGTVFTLSNTNGSGTGAVLKISTTSTGAANAIQGAVSGISNTGTAGYFSNSSPTGWGIYASGTSPNSFAGIINVALGYGYQVNGGNVLTLPDSDTTSLAMGSSALAAQSATSLNNTALGNAALFSATNISNNTAAGYQAAYSLNANGNTTAVGAQALYSATAGPNDAFGYQAAMYVGSGINNAAFGAQAMLGVSGNLVTGNENTAAGYQSLYAIQGAATGNTAVGAQALYSSTTGSYSTAVGAQALYNATASPNDAFGYRSGYMITTGTANVGAGAFSVGGTSASNLTGNGNTGIGYAALANVSGAATGNTAVGALALTANTSGSGNTALGAFALYSNTTATGSSAMGYQALYSATAGPNDAFGYQALYSNTTGTGNAGMGYQALYSNVSGNGNTAVGRQALYGTTGGGNTGIGYQAGYAGTPNTTGTNNTFIGGQAQANGAAYTNGIVIGSSAVLTASNSAVLGNSSITALYAKVTSITAISDRRLKKDITDLPSSLGLEFIDLLRPVTYRFNNGDDTQRYGFIAQEVEQALPKDLQSIVETAQPGHGLALIERGNDKDRTYRVNYGEFIASIIKALQEQQTQIDDTGATIAQLGTPDAAIDEGIRHLNDRLDREMDRLYLTTAMACLSGLLAGIFCGRRKNLSAK